MSLEMLATSEAGAVATPAKSAPRLGRRFAGLWSACKLLMQCALVGALAYATFLFATHYLLQSVHVVGNSMAPTLADSERYLLNRWVYLMREPKATDIVVIRDPEDHNYAVKRIVAGNGDSIYLKAGRIYVNGRALNEPYLAPGTPTYASPKVREQWVVCGKDKYFVLGDNRNNSTDSRIYGPVSRQDILGVIIH